MNTQVIETIRDINPDGTMNIRQVETTTIIDRIAEPDYIKIYTDMWCDANQIPLTYRTLFLELALRMTYTDAKHPECSQIVHVGYPTNISIIEACGWSTEPGRGNNIKGQDSLNKGLRALCKCNAIKHVGRGAYQINPSYAGRGSWKYDARQKRGGIEELRIQYNISKNGVVNTSEIVWADDGKHTEENQMMRDSLGVSAKDRAVITDTHMEDDFGIDNPFIA